jgi:hypothetical protein
MGRVYTEISEQLGGWIAQQPMFFVGTAPSGADGHVNISPKGSREAFAILGPRTAAYVDMIGSGVETIAHLRENGRIVMMFCAFAGPPKIVRLHGSGRVILESDPEFPELLTRFTLKPEVQSLARAVIIVDVSRISDSCGFAVPEMEFVRERDQLFRWAETRDAKEGDSWRAEYKRAKNAASIDGLRAIEPDITLAEA